MFFYSRSANPSLHLFFKSTAHIMRNMTPMFKCAERAEIAQILLHYLTNPIKNKPDSAIPSYVIMALYSSFVTNGKKKKKKREMFYYSCM